MNKPKHSHGYWKQIITAERELPIGVAQKEEADPRKCTLAGEVHLYRSRTEDLGHIRMLAHLMGRRLVEHTVHLEGLEHLAATEVVARTLAAVGD